MYYDTKLLEINLMRQILFCVPGFNLAADIFGEHVQNYWDLWIQPVPDLGDNIISILNETEDGRMVCSINKGIMQTHGQTLYFFLFRTFRTQNILFFSRLDFDFFQL